MDKQFQRQFAVVTNAYLEYLEKADLNGLLGLFAPQAEVLSPLYGKQLATTFYRKLFADTEQSVLRLKDILVNPEAGSGCIFFTYSWTLANGEVVSFDVIDYLQLNETGQITFLQIVYDTVQSRPAWSQ